MAEDLGGQLANMWNRFRARATDAVTQQSASLVRGRIAAHDVYDASGSLLVAAGHVVDETVIERATAAGKMPALVAAVAAAQTQDLKERIQAEYDRTPDGQERRNLADSDEYIEARRHIRWVAAVEVTDVRGAVLVPAGHVIEDDDIRRVRDAGQLAALIYSAEQSGPPAPIDLTSYAPPPDAARVSRRTAVPLAGPHEDESQP